MAFKNIISIYVLKKDFLKQSLWKDRVYKKVLSFLFILIISCQVFAADNQPNFVVNAIARVPKTFQKLPNLDEYKIDVEKLPYHIEKDTNAKNPRRGKIVIDSYTSDQSARGASSVLTPFFDKISKQSFSEASENTVSHRVRVAVLLNRMKSVDESTNLEFYNVVDDLPTTIEYRVISCLWEPQWIKKDIIAGQTKLISVELNEVSDYYKKLKETNSSLADAFLQINEHQELNSIVPYRELREILLKNEATESLVRASRIDNPKSPVYIAFMDGDVISLRAGQKGVFSCYEETIKKSEKILHGLTTGYCVSISQNPFASLSVALDLVQRQALSTVFPLAPYYPEPNAIIRVLDDYETLEVSFPEIKLDRHSNYTSPQELPLLIKEVIRHRFQRSNFLAAPHFRFIQEGAIETEMPARFLQNRKKKDGTKNAKLFSGEFSQETDKIVSLTHQDLTMVRNTSQSHLKSRDWSGYVYKYLEEKMLHENITVVDVNQPGSIVKNRKDQFLISMFSSIHSAYSPTAITLREVENNGYNLLEYLFALTQRYETMVPTALNITFGETYKSTKLTGDLIRKHVSTYEGVCDIIDKFYHQPMAKLIVQAGYVCGKSEIPVLIRYIQYVPVQVPKVGLTIKIKQPQKAAIIFPTAAFTPLNVKKLLNSLHQRVTYKAIDTFTDLTPGNSSRIANSSKTVSENIKKLWAKFNTKDWSIVLNGLKLSLQELAIIMNIKLDDLKVIQGAHNFLDVFFFQI